MRIIGVISLLGIFLFTLSCTKKSDSAAPESIADTVLVGKTTSGSGAFANLQGYQFTTSFDNNLRFQTKNASGVLESMGNYSYKKVDANAATLILQASSDHAGEALQITLKFTSTNSGVYEARFVSGGQGEQTGIFDLK